MYVICSQHDIHVAIKLLIWSKATEKEINKGNRITCSIDILLLKKG